MISSSNITLKTRGVSSPHIQEGGGGLPAPNEGSNEVGDQRFDNMFRLFFLIELGPITG